MTRSSSLQRRWLLLCLLILAIRLASVPFANVHVGSYASPYNALTEHSDLLDRIDRGIDLLLTRDTAKAREDLAKLVAAREEIQDARETAWKTILGLSIVRTATALVLWVIGAALIQAFVMFRSRAPK